MARRSKQQSQRKSKPLPQDSKRRWTTPEQYLHLASFRLRYLLHKRQGTLHQFWGLVENATFKKWPAVELCTQLKLTPDESFTRKIHESNIKKPKTVLGKVKKVRVVLCLRTFTLTVHDRGSTIGSRTIMI